MQTNFTPEQLRDPEIAVANQILRTCVHCGFCTATCPTFVLLGDELDSPRGRIYLIKDMLESGRPASEEVVRHVDRCLSCLACMTTCPSGVDYMHLVDHARAHIEETYRRPWHDRALRALLARVLPRPRLFRAALDPLLEADRASAFRLPNEAVVVIWRGPGGHHLDRALAVIRHLLADLPERLPEWERLAETFRLPEAADTLLGLIAASEPAARRDRSGAIAALGAQPGASRSLLLHPPPPGLAAGGERTDGAAMGGAGARLR